MRQHRSTGRSNSAFTSFNKKRKSKLKIGLPFACCQSKAATCQVPISNRSLLLSLDRQTDDSKANLTIWRVFWRLFRKNGKMYVVICRFFFDSQFSKLVMRYGSSTLQLLLFFPSLPFSLVLCLIMLSFSLRWTRLFDVIQYWISFWTRLSSRKAYLQIDLCY